MLMHGLLLLEKRKTIEFIMTSYSIEAIQIILYGSNYYGENIDSSRSHGTPLSHVSCVTFFGEISPT